MPKPNALVPDEILQPLFDNVPVLVDIIGADGFIEHVNPCWEETLGWSQKVIASHRPDIFAECFPHPDDRKRALDFVFAGRGEWADFRLRTRTGRVIPMAWTEIPLSGGRVLGIGVQERERRFVGRRLSEPDAYLRKLFAPSPGADPHLKLLHVKAHGDELALCLRTGKHRVIATVPVALVNLSARYGSADLILRIVRNAVLNGGAEGPLRGPKGARDVAQTSVQGKKKSVQE